MRISYHVLSAPAPIGLLFAAMTERGLRYLEFMDRKSLKRMIASHAAQNPGAAWEPSVRELRPLGDQLEEFFHGHRRAFEIPLDLAGSEFQLAVWRALGAIPYGATHTYGEIARAIGEPKSARAVGLACNQNPLAILVPCHRAIGADGKLVGYSGGLTRKKSLLALETRFGPMQALDSDHAIQELSVRTRRPLVPVRAPALRTGVLVKKARRAPAPVPAPRMAVVRSAKSAGPKKLSAPSARRRAR